MTLNPNPCCARGPASIHKYRHEKYKAGAPSKLLKNLKNMEIYTPELCVATLQQLIYLYDGPSVKEKIFKYFFHHHILGGENIFKYIFTTVFWGEEIYSNLFSPPYFGGRKEIYLNIFSPPYFWGRKYIQIYFHQCIFGGENIFKFIFTAVFWGEKIYLNLFPPPYVWGRQYTGILIYFHHRIFGGENIF